VLAERNVTVRYKHIANSGALLQFPNDVAWDLVRPGVAIYGMYPSDEVDRGIGLRPVMRLESRIVKVTRYHRDWAVGYGRTWPVSEGAVVGIIPIGYGDGYPRVLSSRASVLVHGMRVPIAGRVSMDMIAVDLTGVPEEVEVGDETVLLGRQEWIPRERNVAARSDEIDASELAQLCDTITYEITCGFTARIPRVYTRRGTPIAIQTMRDGYKRL
jgi:alanine racemase